MRTHRNSRVIRVRPEANPGGPLVDAEIRPDPVARPVHVVEPALPQGGPGQRVEPVAGHPGREDGQAHPDLALQHPGEAVLLVLGRRAEVQRPRHVRRPVLVLRAGVHQVQLVRRQPPAEGGKKERLS